MGTAEWAALNVVLGLLVIFVSLRYVSVRRQRDLLADRLRSTDGILRHREDVIDDIRVLVFGEEDRYSIEIEDWGPDFTGLDDTLPRWRWLVWDADREVKQALRTFDSDEAGVTVPYMLGNAPTRAQALTQALAFVERRQHPAMILHIDPASPHPAATVVL
jgi:hypothetical protein